MEVFDVERPLDTVLDSFSFLDLSRASVLSFAPHSEIGTYDSGNSSFKSSTTFAEKGLPTVDGPLSATVPILSGTADFCEAKRNPLSQMKR